MANKHFAINEETREITVDINKISPEDLAKVKTLCEFGYKFVAKQAAKRSGSTRTKAHYMSELVKEDREIFEALPYRQAVSFASGVITIGILADENNDLLANLEEFRALAKEDFVAAKAYARKTFGLYEKNSKAIKRANEIKAARAA